MEQRQLRLGDILDDYCPRERRVTNHAVVAMVGAEVKQTRCTTCEAEHEYKHAKVPRQRRKADSPAALYAQVSAGAPKRVAHEAPASARSEPEEAAPRSSSIARDETTGAEPAPAMPERGEAAGAREAAREAGEVKEGERDEGPVHRPLIRASLPRPEGQPPPSRPIPEFTIRQPAGRQGHFRARHGRGGGGQQPFPGHRPHGNLAGGPPRGGHHQGGMRRHGPGRKRSK